MVIIETAHFERIRRDYLTDDQYSLLGWTLECRPAAGSIISGSGGIRKLRWPMPGRGKRGGLRVLYYWIVPRDQILMLTLFSKSDMADLTRAEIKCLKKLISDLKT